MKIQNQRITNHGIKNKNTKSKLISQNNSQKKLKNNSKNDNKRLCLICGKPAVCAKNGCWRVRDGKANCSKCKERYCEKHWTNIVRKL